MSIDLIAACQSSRIVTDEAETLRDTLDDVTHAITTSVDILNDLLTFDKLQSGVMQIHVTDINVKSFVQDCCSIFMAQARGDNIRLSVLFADDSVAGSTPITAQDMVRCDNFKTSQVVRNLLSNALKFTPDAGSVVVRVCFVPVKEGEGRDVGHVQPSTADAAPQENRPRSTVASMLSRVQSALVSVSGQRPRPRGSQHLARQTMTDDVERTRGALHLSVTDSGAGISQTDQARLFREVVQFNPDVLQGGGGSGLGLYICKSIVDLHGGRIDVASEGEGLGSTFSVVLPMCHTPLDLSLLDLPVHPVLSHPGSDKALSTSLRLHSPIGQSRRRSNQIHLLDVDVDLEAGAAHAAEFVMDDAMSATSETSLEAVGVTSPRLSPWMGTGRSSGKSCSESTGLAEGVDGAGGAGGAGGWFGASPPISPQESPRVKQPARHSDQDGHVLRDGHVYGLNGRHPPGKDTGKDTGKDSGDTSVEGVSVEVPVVEEASMQRFLQCLDRESWLSPRFSDLEDCCLASESDSSVDLNEVEIDVAATVLVVEDVRVNRQVMVKLFKSLGQTVDAAVDGKDAVNKVKKRMFLQLPPYDAILMDFKMVSRVG